MTVAFEGRLCDCGRRGCLGPMRRPAIADRARGALALAPEQASSLRHVPGGAAAITAVDVTSAAASGDVLAAAVWDETVEALGAGIANVINSFNPERVILGGGVTKAGDMLFEPVRRIALAQCFGPLLRVAEIVPAELGDQGGVMGAVATALDRLDAEVSPGSARP